MGTCFWVLLICAEAMLSVVKLKITMIPHLIPWHSQRRDFEMYHPGGELGRQNRIEMAAEHIQEVQAQAQARGAENEISQRGD
jgi:hypothetical protein